MDLWTTQAVRFRSKRWVRSVDQVSALEFDTRGCADTAGRAAVSIGARDADILPAVSLCYPGRVAVALEPGEIDRVGRSEKATPNSGYYAIAGGHRARHDIDYQAGSGLPQLP